MYPFKPKSTQGLVPGQFWGIPLSGGRFACGRVLELNAPTIPTPTRSFFGGLHDWIGTEPPTADAISRSGFVDHGVMHIKAITEIGGKVLGIRPLAADGSDLPTLLSAMGGKGAMILRGATPVREALVTEWGKLPVLGYWGYDYIQVIAEQKLV